MSSQVCKICNFFIRSISVELEIYIYTHTILPSRKTSCPSRANLKVVFPERLSTAGRWRLCLCVKFLSQSTVRCYHCQTKLRDYINQGTVFKFYQFSRYFCYQMIITLILIVFKFPTPPGVVLEKCLDEVSQACIKLLDILRQGNCKFKARLENACRL